MSGFKIDELMFCEVLVGQALAATQGGFSLNVYRGRRAFRKSVDVFGEIGGKPVKEGVESLPNAPVLAPTIVPSEISVMGSGIVPTVDGGRFNGSSVILNGSGGFSIGTSI
jgi:hypothetical protein